MEQKKLSSGYEMPVVALGVFKVDPKDTEASVLAALNNGYRHIDTAAIYGNEKEVGEAIRKSGVPREEIFLTTKVWNDDIRAGRTREALEESLEKLGTDYVDLYLIHWPTEGREQAFEEMEELRKEGKIRTIGVSNFKKHHLEELIEATGIVPAVDQMEYNPGIQDDEVLTFCKDHGIVLEAWSPLGRGAYLNAPEIVEIAQKHGKTTAQVILRWLLQKGIVVLPKSIHEDRIISNLDLFDFELNAEEMDVLNAMNTGKRIGSDPDHFNF